jgi:Uma2 family endonuclease
MSVDATHGLLTKEEYYRLSAAGRFDGRRVQLINGELIEMADQTNFHAMAIDMTKDVLQDAFGNGYWVRAQFSLDLSPLSVPDPDLAVVEGNRQQHSPDHNPTTAVLIVEVSWSTLATDRRLKGSLYAASGIADYWIVNLEDRQLEVYREPVPDEREPLEYRYLSITIHDHNGQVSPLARPDAMIRVHDLLP